MRNLLSHFGKLSASNIWHLPRNAIALAITGYQHTFSPDHGPLKSLYTYGYCRHSPTCSVYAKKAVLERGAVIGSLLAARRVLSCHPWKKLSEEKILEISARNSKCQIPISKQNP